MKQLKNKVPTLAVCIAIPIIVSIGFAVREAGLESQRARSRITVGLPSQRVGVVQLPNGSWCAERLPSACVSASGETYIPGGEIATTLDALISICEKMPGAPDTCGGVLLTKDREIHTRAVSGRMSPDEALARMLEGTGMKVTGDFKTGVGFEEAFNKIGMWPGHDKVVVLMRLGQIERVL